MMAAQALVERGDGDIEREEVIEALSGHVCRCTGYVKIVDAVTAAVRGDVSPAHASADTDPQGEDAVTLDPGEPGMKAVGARLPRYDGIAHVTGRTQYVDDVRVHGTLWCKALRSPHHTRAHPLDRHDQGARRCPACTRSSPTRTCPTTSTATSRRLGVPADEPLLAEDDVRWKGQPIAAVAAESEEIAQAAVDAIEIDFEEREPILDIRTAADPGAGEHFHQWGADLSALRAPQPPPRAQGRRRGRLRRRPTSSSRASTARRPSSTARWRRRSRSWSPSRAAA